MGEQSTIAIIGGGIVGSSTAYHLALADRAADVIVFEPDSTYEFAATPRATGTIRRTFSLREKVQMSTYAHEVYERFEDLLQIAGQAAGHADFKAGGYLYVVCGAAGMRQIERVKEVMEAESVRTQILDPAGIQSLFPAIRVDDVDGGLYSPDDGWIEPHGALQGFRKKARSLGVTYRAERVVGVTVVGNAAASLTLGSGEVVRVSVVVNCANCWAPEVCAMVGMTVPIVPLKRMTYYFDSKVASGPIPLTRDTSGVSVRPEGKGYITGITDYSATPGFDWSLDYAWFEDTVWPRLAHRIPEFEKLRMGRCWSGHYDMNVFDRCPIIGPWSGVVNNFYVAAGFSGHGLQHAPAVGRGLSELILTGSFQALDLSPFSYARIEKNRPLLDEGPVS